MTEPRFDILFAGEILQGFSRESVEENIARLFKASPDTVARLMDGGTHVLKRGTDRDTAIKYETALERAGARAILRAAAVEPAAAATSAPPAPAPAAPAPVAATSTPGSALSLAPAGADMLAPHERRAIEAVAVDTSGITLASPFMANAGTALTPPPAPDTSHISIAAPGADLREGRSSPAPPPPPDTSALSLAAPGELLAPADERPPVALPDLDGISLAPPGTPLDEIKPDRKPLDPDTSGLSIEAPRF
jgi:hypothetical protein